MNFQDRRTLLAAAVLAATATGAQDRPPYQVALYAVTVADLTLRMLLKQEFSLNPTLDDDTTVQS